MDRLLHTWASYPDCLVLQILTEDGLDLLLSAVGFQEELFPTGSPDHGREAIQSCSRHMGM